MLPPTSRRTRYSLASTSQTPVRNAPGQSRRVNKTMRDFYEHRQEKNPSTFTLEDLKKAVGAISRGEETDIGRSKKSLLPVHMKPFTLNNTAAPTPDLLPDGTTLMAMKCPTKRISPMMILILQLKQNS